MGTPRQTQHPWRMRQMIYKLKTWAKERLLRVLFLRNLLAWFGLYRFSVTQTDQMKNINRIYLLTHYDTEYRANLVKEMKKDPDSSAIIEKRSPIIIQRNHLKKYPANSLGQAYYQFVIRNHITPLVYRPCHFKKSDEYTYIILRIICTHDIYHVLLEQQTDIIAEGFVAGFTIAQMPAYLPPSIHICAGFLNQAVFKNNTLDDEMKAIFCGWLTGLQSQPLFPVNWADFWSEDINAVRKALSIKKIPFDKTIKELMHRDAYNNES